MVEASRTEKAASRHEPESPVPLPAPIATIPNQRTHANHRAEVLRCYLGCARSPDVDGSLLYSEAYEIASAKIAMGSF